MALSVKFWGVNSDATASQTDTVVALPVIGSAYRSSAGQKNIPSGRNKRGRSRSCRLLQRLAMIAIARSDDRAESDDLGPMRI